MTKKKRVRLDDEPEFVRTEVKKNNRPALHDSELPAVSHQLSNQIYPKAPTFETLNKRERSFCYNYIQTYNRVKACLDAGFNPSFVETKSYTLLQRKDIRAYISKLEREQDQRIEIQADDIVREHYRILVADPNSLMQVRRIPCRFCWGESGEYQRTEQEMEQDLSAWKMGRRGKPYASCNTIVGGRTNKTTFHAWRRGKDDLPFDTMGGTGYTANKFPNEKCTSDPCHGHGIIDPNHSFFVEDTRFLDSDGRALFAGFEIQKGGGVKVLMRSKDASLDFLTKRFQLDKKTIVDFDPENMSEDELDAVLAAALKKQTLEQED